MHDVCINRLPFQACQPIRDELDESLVLEVEQHSDDLRVWVGCEECSINQPLFFVHVVVEESRHEHTIKIIQFVDIYWLGPGSHNHREVSLLWCYPSLVQEIVCFFVCVRDQVCTHTHRCQHVEHDSTFVCMILDAFIFSIKYAVSRECSDKLPIRTSRILTIQIIERVVLTIIKKDLELLQYRYILSSPFLE